MSIPPQQEYEKNAQPPSYEEANTEQYPNQSYPAAIGFQPGSINQGGQPYPMHQGGQSYPMTQGSQPYDPMLQGNQPYPNQGVPQQYANPYGPPPTGQYPKQMYEPAGGIHQQHTTTVIATQPTVPLFLPVHVPDYAALSWFACLCCFWPIGICAILKSHEVNRAIAANDIPGAQQSSQDARKYANISILIGIIVIIIIIVIRVVAISASS